MVLQLGSSVLLSYARRQVLVSGVPEYGGVQLGDDYVEWMLQDEDATKLEKCLVTTIHPFSLAIDTHMREPSFPQ